jgi:transcriptional regulator with XRE-family HTH domain
MHVKFGDMVKDLRIAQHKTLRQFCLENNQDPSNWSKIERNINPPPRDQDTLVKWALMLGITEDSEKWKEFMMIADIARGEIPRSVMSNEQLLAKLPVFFRTVTGQALTEEKLDRLIEQIRKVNSPDEPQSPASK